MTISGLIKGDTRSLDYSSDFGCPTTNRNPTMGMDG